MVEQHTHPPSAVRRATYIVGVIACAFTILFLFFWRAQDVRGVVVQKRENECGVAATAMVLADLGIRIPYEELADRLLLSRDGTSVQRIVEVLDSIGIGAAAWMADYSLLKSIEPPAILFVDGGHFLVLDSLRGGEIFLRDPAKGRLRLSKTELQKRWSGATILVEQALSAP